jgi:hypothetical protein
LHREGAKNAKKSREKPLRPLRGHGVNQPKQERQPGKARKNLTFALARPAFFAGLRLCGEGERSAIVLRLSPDDESSG